MISVKLERDREMQNPSEAVILERSKSFCNEACFTIALQCRRLRTTEPEDEVFIFRWYADLQFLIMALRRLRRAAGLAARVPQVSDSLKIAIKEFDNQLPNLAKMRNVGEHIDDYVTNNKQNRHKDIQRHVLQCSSWDGTVFTWLGVDLDIDIALKASEGLFGAVNHSAKLYSNSHKAQ